MAYQTYKGKFAALFKPAPLEKAFDRMLTPFEEFIHRETTSGLLLIVATICALLLANSPLGEAYAHLLHVHFSLTLGSYTFLDLSLHHWINDGLMALFFFVVGLEIKREILVGELADIRQAILPVIAAIGGMIVPALLYLGFNQGTPQANGWGVPMATDIAFAVGVLVLLGSRIPHALISFLVALAIVDDLGAVLVIAVFYTDTIHFGALLAAAVLLGVLLLFNQGGIRKPWPYILIGVLLWLALLKSGIHATLAGVLVALTIPARSKYDPEEFSQLIRVLAGRFHHSFKNQHDLIWQENQRRGMLQSLGRGVYMMETPLQRMEHSLHMPVAFLIIPLFALANAGIPLSLDMMSGAFSNPVAQGIIIGLVVGKFIGVGLVSLLAVKLGIGRLPEGVSAKHILGVAWLAGIGFTMSIFISELGFQGSPETIIVAKTGILAASLLAAVLGLIWLFALGKAPSTTKSTELPHEAD